MNLQQELDTFNGTQFYYDLKYPFGKLLVYTDGIKYLADKAGAYWLIDIVASHLLTNSNLRKEEFQVWKLVRTGSQALVTCDDGNGNIIVEQKIQYTDFPLEKIKLYLEFGSIDGKNRVWVLMLPGER